MRPSKQYCITRPGRGCFATPASHSTAHTTPPRGYSNCSNTNGVCTAPRKIVDLLIDEGSEWLRRIPTQYRWHTFTLATYEDGNPFVYVISNFERPGGAYLSTPTEVLFKTRVKPRGPRCIVTGQSQAVSEQQRAALKEVLAQQPPEKRATALSHRPDQPGSGGERTSGHRKRILQCGLLVRRWLRADERLRRHSGQVRLLR